MDFYVRLSETEFILAQEKLKEMFERKKLNKLIKIFDNKHTRYKYRNSFYLRKVIMKY